MKSNLVRYRPTRNTVLLLGLLLFALVLYVSQFNLFQVGTWIDDANYIVLAKSIVMGKGYGLINSPDVILPTHFPFGFPLLLAPVCGLFNCDFQALKLVSLLFSLANIIVLVKGWKYLGMSSEAMGLAVAALYAASRSAVGFAATIMSEPAFTFFSLVCLILTVKESNSPRTALASALVLGVLWVFAAYVRTIGITLVAASALWLVVRKRLTKLSFAAIGFVGAIGLILLCTDIRWQNLYDFSGYTDDWISTVRNFSTDSASVHTEPGAPLIEPSVRYRTTHLFIRIASNALVPFINGNTVERVLTLLGIGFVPDLVSIFIMLTVAIGYVVLMRRQGLMPAHLYVPLYNLLILVWGPSDRFLYPILALLFAYLLSGAGFILDQLAKWRRNPERFVPPKLPYAATAVVVLFFLQLASSAHGDNSLLHVRDFRAGTLWLRENTPSDAVIVAEQPQAIYLYARRPTIDLADTDLPVQARAREKEAYLLIAPDLKWKEDGILEYDQQTLQILKSVTVGLVPAQLVYEDAKSMVKIYQIQ